MVFLFQIIVLTRFQQYKISTYFFNIPQIILLYLKSWAGQPLVDIETVIDLIGSTTTQQGLKVKCLLDPNHYPTGIKVSDADYQRIRIERIHPLSDWNYIIYGFHRS